ncbi:hypothetical protein GW17_00004620 [Ensete ventricosum]|nr:hypothetical protein GW17_00004620 [Ensete ventricosum]
MSRIGNPYSVSIAASVSSLRHAIGGLRFVPLTPFHHFLYLNIFICLLRRRYLEKSEEIEHRDRGKVSQEEKPSLVRLIGAPGLIAPPPLRPGIRRWRALAVGNLSSSSGLRKRYMRRVGSLFFLRALIDRVTKFCAVKIGRSRLAISYCTGVSISCWYDTYLAVLSYTEHTDTWYTKGHGVVLVNTDEAGTLAVTNFRILFVVRCLNYCMASLG